MVGPDLLAAPVTASRAEADGEADQPTPVSVYLPAGRWTDLYSGQVVQGGRTIVNVSGLDEFPLYMRAGTAIGFNARMPSVWSGGWGTDDLSKAGLAGWMYAPGPGSSRAVGYGGGSLSASDSGGQVRLTLHGAPAHAQVLVLTQRPPRSVTVDGRTLSAASAAALRGVASGWTFTAGSFGGVLLKLAPPPGGTATVILTAG